MDDANIGPIVPRQRGVRDSARSEVLYRHAKLMKNGRPVFCTPSLAELSGRVPPRQSRGTDGKVIYPTREAAEAAARELEALGARALRSYVCGRSRRGHFHLTTDHTPHRGARRDWAMPRTDDTGSGGSLPAGAERRLPSIPAQPVGPVAALPLHLRIPRQAGPRAS